MKICFIQSSEEIKLIKEKISDIPIVVPLSLEALSFCDLMNIKFIDINELISKNFFLKTNNALENFLKDLNFDFSEIEFLKTEIRSILRYKYYQISFIIEIIENLKKENNNIKILITNMYSSQKYQNTNTSPGNNFTNIEEIFTEIYADNTEVLKVKKIENDENNFIYNNYKIKGLRYTDKKKILFNNSGYNFKRIIIHLLKNRQNIAFMNEGLSFFKKIIFKILGIEILEFSEIKKNKFKREYSIDQKILVDNLNISRILNKQIDNCSTYLRNLKSKNEALKEYFNNSNIKLVISNSNRGAGGMIIENAHRLKVTSLLISHGTVAESFNKDDEIYKKNIAEAVFSGKATYFAVQSKIMLDSLKTHKLLGKPIVTGNLVFAESKTIKQSKKFKILYAVTNKKFPGMQFLGVEVFYEFYKNLKDLEKFSIDNSFYINVHLHPSVKSSINFLRKKFKNLYFTIGSIEKALKDALVTISYSSSVIEDSLNSKVPVILLDTKLRYKHCKSTANTSEINEPIYYINNFYDLKKCIETIKNSENINFKKKVYEENYKKNIKKLFDDLLK